MRQHDAFQGAGVPAYSEGVRCYSILCIALTGATLLTFGHSVVLAQEPEGESIVPPRFTSEAQTDLYDRMSSRLIAPCCWSAPVRFHQSQEASRVRMELISDIRAGMNDKEIQDRFAREYGERILGQPRGPRSVVAYAIPTVCSVLGIFALTAFVASRRRFVPLVAAGPTEALPDLPDLD